MKIGFIPSLLMITLLLAGCGGSAETTAPQTTMVQPPVTTSATAPITQSTVSPPVSVTASLPSTPTNTVTTKTATQSVSTIPLITSAELYDGYVKLHFNPVSLVTENPNYVTVDAREIEPYNASHVPATVSIIPNIYNTSVGSDAIKNQLITLPKGVLIVFYDNDMDLAPGLAQQLLDLNKSMSLGYDSANVKVLSGGFGSWRELNYPTMSAEQ
jgi:rhodanese-related sulfurtransferase